MSSLESIAYAVLVTLAAALGLVAAFYALRVLGRLLILPVDAICDWIDSLPVDGDRR